MITVPPEFAAWTIRIGGEAGRDWVVGLPGLVENLCADWGLTLDGAPPRHGGQSIVVLVRRGEQRLVLRIGREDTAREARALTRWAGRGAVRLLEHRPGAMLLERLDPEDSLHRVELRAAGEVAGFLARRLAVPVPDGFPSLSGTLAGIAAGLPGRQRRLGDPVPRAWFSAAHGLAEELSTVPGKTLVHADLHYGNILAGGHEPWLAIDPRPVRGFPEFSVPELMWTRADEAGSVRGLLDVIVRAGEMDHALARACTVVRCVDYWLWGAERGLTIDPVRCEKVLAGL